MRGISVTLFSKSEVGVDVLGNPIYEETGEIVENVLVGEPSSDDIITASSLYGKTISYMLGIPKGDKHDWIDKKVEWSDGYGTHTVQTFGFPITGVEANIPTPWHMKVRCSAYG